jgi:hypothetical protein
MLSVEVEWLESTHDRALSIDRGPTWFWKDDRMICIIGDWAGQLGESG